MIYLRNYFFIFIFKIYNKYAKFFKMDNLNFTSKKILEKNFRKKSNFNFVQIGANDGKSFDFLYDFIIERNSSGIVIEPIKEYYEELIYNYRNFSKIVKINKAVHPTLKNVIINRLNPNCNNKYPEWAKGIGSLDIFHYKKSGIHKIDMMEEKVDADNLMNIIDNNILTFELDYFQVDTEGFDFEVIKMLDFNKIKPNIVKYEYVNLNKQDNENLVTILKNQNYFLFVENGDKIGINLKKIKLF